MSDEEEVKLPQKRSLIDEEGRVQLSETRFATVSEFRKRQYVNIREYYKDEAGDLKPGKKGIALKPSEWKKLLEASQELNEKLTD
jgi:hypothetical protein